MIERYTNEVMGSIWSEQNEWDTLKQVEILASEAQAELGNIPKEAAEQIREKAAFPLTVFMKSKRKLTMILPPSSLIFPRT